jgi:hypothetical protein
MKITRTGRISDEFAEALTKTAMWPFKDRQKQRQEIITLCNQIMGLLKSREMTPLKYLLDSILEFTQKDPENTNFTNFAKRLKWELEKFEGPSPEHANVSEAADVFPLLNKLMKLCETSYGTQEEISDYLTNIKEQLTGEGPSFSSPYRWKSKR